MFHFLLELCNVSWSHPYDDEIIDIHAGDELPTSDFSTVHGMLMLTLAKPKLVQGPVQLLIPRPRRLPQTIQCSPKLQHFVFFSGSDETRWLLHVHFLCKLSVEERRLHVHEMYFPTFIHHKN
jgi:hypothetical protein